MKDIEYYNYYKFNYLFITYLILKANNLNRVSIDSIKNIDIYVVELLKKEKSLSKTF